jgi:hypothetical protein
MFGDGFLGQLSEKDRELILKNRERVAKAGDYARTGLMRGLVVEDRIGANPFKFGMIGSTDSHTAMPSAERRTISFPERRVGTWVPPALLRCMPKRTPAARFSTP